MVFEKKINLFRFVSILFAVISLSACSDPKDPISAGTIGDGTFLSIIEESVRDNNLPALSVIVTENGEVVESAAVGRRSFAQSTRVTEADFWQAGSLSKAVTATLAARLVELGFINWDTTIAEAFSGYLDQIHPGYHAVTLAEGFESGACRESWFVSLQQCRVYRCRSHVRASGKLVMGGCATAVSVCPAGHNKLWYWLP